MDLEQFQALMDILGKIRFGQLVIVFMVSSIWAKSILDMWKNR